MQRAALNMNGDQYVATTGSHGADISSQRLDMLDRDSISHCLKFDKLRCLDLGCGLGEQAIRFAAINASVVAVDFIKMSDRLRKANELFSDRIEYIEGDARDAIDDLEAPFDCIYAQRFIHYLRADEAIELMRKLKALLSPSGKVFISASGMKSELGIDYKHRNQPWTRRFASLSSPIGRKHMILEPVCLYMPDDMATLAHNSGYTLDKMHVSEFGNLKAELIPRL